MPATAPLVASLCTLISVVAETVWESVWELFAPLGSEVALLTVAVLLMDEPFGASGVTLTVRLKTAGPSPIAKVPRVQVIVPFEPTAGVVHKKGEPPF